ncbi:hypothetical protein [Gelatiniphilus marinus]|uniref:AraC family transcriptional regulator n=1 Tax=Gelatiniphilus marinus TaxID=1759464 RepID=A0ABW5JUD2_9FLAO
MEIRFKNSEYSLGEIVKSFNKDFETSILAEKQYTEFKDGVTGSVKEIHLNNAYILFQDHSTEKPENYTLQVDQNHPVLLLQFVFDGDITFSLDEKKSTTYRLDKNMYNLFSIPASKYLYKHLNYKKKNIKYLFYRVFFSEKNGSMFYNKF